MSRFNRSLLAAAILAAAATSSQAALLGSTVDAQYYAYGSVYNGGGSPASFVADGAAHAQFFDYYDITVTDTQIIYDYLGGNSPWSASDISLDAGGLFIRNGNLLTFTGAPTITSVSLDPSSNMAGFTNANITFNGTNVAVEWANLEFDANTRVVLNVNTSPVPLPAAAFLFAPALAGLGLLGKRKEGSKA